MTKTLPDNRSPLGVGLPRPSDPVATFEMGTHRRAGVSPGPPSEETGGVGFPEVGSPLGHWCREVWDYMSNREEALRYGSVSRVLQSAVPRTLSGWSFRVQLQSSS